MYHNGDYWGQQSPDGKQITEKRLGVLLAQAAKATPGRIGGAGLRGYVRIGLEPAWRRLGIPFLQSGEPGEPDEPGDENPYTTALTIITGLTGLQGALPATRPALPRPPAPAAAIGAAGTSKRRATNPIAPVPSKHKGTGRDPPPRLCSLRRSGHLRSTGRSGPPHPLRLSGHLPAVLPGAGRRCLRLPGPLRRRPGRR